MKTPDFIPLFVGLPIMSFHSLFFVLAIIFMTFCCVILKLWPRDSDGKCISPNDLEKYQTKKPPKDNLSQKLLLMNIILLIALAAIALT